MGKLKPLENRILIKLLPAQEKIMDRFEIPTSSQKVPNRGEVVGIGKEVEKSKEIKVGDIAIFDDKFGVVITEENQDYRVLDKRDVFAIIQTK